MTPASAPPATSAPAPPLAYEPFDADYCRTLEREVLEPVTERYFRATIIGADRIPSDGPVILAANHSGNAFPHDGIVLDALLWQLDRLDPGHKIRTLYEPELTQAWWMRPFGLDNWWRRCGGIDMTFDNFERLLLRRERILYFPEGVPGIGKGFNHRYHLQPFKTSFALLAARHDVPVIPIYIINAEWVHPFGYTFPPLDRVMQRYFHVPFLPLPIGLLAVIFPWMWYLAFPAHMIFVVGKPIDVRALWRAEGITDFTHPDRHERSRVAGIVRRRMQRELAAMVREHGRRPYDVRSLKDALRSANGRLKGVLPWGWPVRYIRHERDRQRPKARTRWHALLRDWDLLGFYLPFGWPLLTLSRRLRRPPYGYRGLPRSAQREKMGEFIWRLSERPLPPKPSRT